MKMAPLFILLFCYQHMNAHSVYALSNYIKFDIPEVNFVHLGDHIVAEFLECQYIEDYDQLEVEAILCDAAQQAHATVIKVMTHKFSPQGMSGLVLLAESHISFHTWPEYGYVAVDTYTCGTHVHVQAIIEALKAFFKPKKVHQILIHRGYDVTGEEPNEC